MLQKIVFAFLCLWGFCFAAVNINTASQAELTTLKGIGTKRAEAIINYRTKNGAFQSIDELKKVDGIGEKTFEAIKTEIVVTDEESGQ